jgi:aconitate hydratase
MPAGARVLPFRSNIPKISEFVYEVVDPDYAARARQQKLQGEHAIVGGMNYGQGSSREHAALAPRFLGLRLVIAKSYARIHRKNLINYGILPLIFDDPQMYVALEHGDVLVLTGLRAHLKYGLEDEALEVSIPKKNLRFSVRHHLTPHMADVLLAGGLTNWVRFKK